MIWIILLLAVSVGAYFLFMRKKDKDSGLVSEPPAPLKASTRTFPSAFGAWNCLDRDTDKTLAFHDLWWHIVPNYNARWSGPFRPPLNMITFPCLSGRIDPESLDAAFAKKRSLRGFNPDMKLLIELGYTENCDEATDIPPEHVFWMRDEHGHRVPGWPYFPYPLWKLNIGSAAYREHVALAAQNAMGTGVWDGMFLDVWSDDANHLDLIQRIRGKVGSKMVIANVNYRICPLTAPYLNGVMMECGSLTTPAQWRQVEQAMDYYQSHLLDPQAICLEVAGPRDQENIMRAATCLTLTHSNGYVLYADPGAGFASTHLHKWHRFWDKSLGKPIGGLQRVGNTSRREFERGTAVYNPMGSVAITLTFPESRVNMANGIRSNEHVLNGFDGGIYVR